MLRRRVRPDAELDRICSDAGISQARARLGWKPLRMLYETLVTPIATRASVGAWYRRWRLVTLDGSTLDVADTPQNERAFGRPGASRGKAGFPQLRFVTLLEKRDARGVRSGAGPLQHGRGDAGQESGSAIAGRCAVSGGPVLLQLSALEAGTYDD